ncbi:MAG: HAMP domain-containing sensor histidine kinase [Alphaproteobacteria bacterium]|nr:HAMP domain-containing sensor histidine kinase [Alphaproteobacteria bacterium]
MTGSWIGRWSLAIVVAMVVLVAGACAAALWFVDSEGRTLIAAQEAVALNVELDLFEAEFRDEGAAALTRSVERSAETGPRFYAVRDPNGVLLAGNIAAWPGDVSGAAPWTTVTLDGRSAHVVTRTLEGGSTLLVGADDAALRAFRDDIVDAAWIAVALVAITCLTLAALITSYMAGRVRLLSAASARVADGDFAARAEGAEEQGPFGEIARAQNAMLDRIEALVTGLVTVTDSIAHDLRTPLSRMRRRLEEGLAADQQEAKQVALEQALTETDRTIATFTALIDISRAEGGISRETMEDVDLAQIVRDAYDLFEPLAEEKAIAFSLEAQSVSIRGHRALLMQAVSNLIHNAIKYGHARVDVSLTAGVEGAEVVVADDGPGIPTEQRAEAVKRFRQVGAQSPEGVGLGLAIVDACARLHRGALVLEDNGPGLSARLSLAAK